jgi:TonB family protein
MKAPDELNAPNAPNARRWDMLRRRWDASFRRGLVASVVLHVLLIFLFRQAMVVPDVPQSAAGPDNRDDRAAAGGGMQVIAYTIAPPAAVPPTPPEEAFIPVPVPVPTERPVPQPEQEPRSAPQPTPPGPIGQAAPSAGEGRGPATGPGTETGTGTGSGGGGEEGTSRVTAPTPRGLILPPSDRPARVRGNTVTVYVFVNERGRVVADSTRLAPSSGDRGFDNRLIRQAADWVFNPARRNGQAIAEWFQYVIVL